MGNDAGRNISTGKRHYDITMSRRTRKASNLEESKKEILLQGQGGSDDREKRNTSETGVDHDNDNKKSLKQLIHGDGNVKVILEEGEGNKCRSSLGQHFTEDKKQQLQPKAKAKGSSVTHYIKVLRHLIKVKQDSRAAGQNQLPPP